MGIKMKKILPQQLPFTRMVHGRNIHVLVIPVSALEIALDVKIAVALLKETKNTEKELQVTKIQNHFFFGVYFS